MMALYNMIMERTNVMNSMVGRSKLHRILKVVLVAGIAVLLVLQVFPGASGSDAHAYVPSPAGASSSAGSSAGKWILKAEEGHLEAILQELGKLETLGIDVLKRSRNYIQVRVPEGLDVAAALAGKLPGLAWMEPDGRVAAAAAPNDPAYSQQWYLRNIHMPEAWDVAETGSPAVVVAVLDSGVAYEDRAGFSQAPDLAGVQFLPGYDFVAGDLYPDDEFWHGTFVTEIICSGWNNGIRAAGVASGISIMPLRVLDHIGEGTLFDVADAVYYAVDNGARIINMSLASLPGEAGENLITEAVNYAYAQGVLCVAAAGNRQMPVEIPASIPSVLAVSATDVNNAFASSYSDYGSAVDLAAPGGDANGWIVQESFATDGNPASSFVLRQESGTSFSCAQVSGVAALMLSVNQDLQASDLASLLTSTCTDVGTPGKDIYYGAGLLNAAGAMQAAGHRTWYFAEGTTRTGFAEWLCLLNSSGTAANATVTYFYGDGLWFDAPVAVPGWTRLTIPVNSVVGEGYDVSVRVMSDSQTLLVERPMYFNYQGKWTGGSAGTGSQRRSQLWFFAEGYTGPGFEEWLCLANPGGADATVLVNYMYTTGAVNQGIYVVPAFSRRTVSVNVEVGAYREVSLKVTSDQPIVAERPMYFFYDGAIDGGHNVLGATYTSNAWYFAEGTTRAGFDEYLTIANPGDARANVSVYYLLGEGQGASRKVDYSVGASSRFTINVRDVVGSDKDVSCVVASDRPVVSERPMYFRYGAWTGGHDVTGANYPSEQWSFCEGTTRAGFEEWLTLANPNAAAANIIVDYIPGYGQGASVRRTYVVAGGTRDTIYVPDAVGREKDVAVLVYSDIPIVAERPMYFRYGTWDGGTDVLGYTTP